LQQGSQSHLVRHAELKGRVDALARTAAGSVHLWSKLFLWGEGRARAEQSMRELADVVEGDSFRALEADLRSGLKALKTRRPDEKALWDDFAKRTATYYALLEQVHSQPQGDEGAARGFIPRKSSKPWRTRSCGGMA